MSGLLNLLITERSPFVFDGARAEAIRVPADVVAANNETGRELVKALRVLRIFCPDQGDRFRGVIHSEVWQETAFAAVRELCGAADAGVTLAPITREMRRACSRVEIAPEVAAACGMPAPADLVAEIGQGLFGVAIVYMETPVGLIVYGFEDGGVVRVRGIAVDRRLQGSGLANAGLQLFLQYMHVQQTGQTRVVCSVPAANKRARAMLRRAGFVEHVQINSDPKMWDACARLPCVQMAPFRLAVDTDDLVQWRIHSNL